MTATKRQMWPKVKLGSVADLQGGYSFKSSDFFECGTPIIKIKNVLPTRVVLDDAQYFDGDINEKLKPFLVTHDDILISMTGSNLNQMSSAVGKVGRYRYNEPALLNQRVGKIYVTKTDKLDDTFLYYFLTQKSVRYNLAANASGSANQANISAAQIKGLKFHLPPLPTQKRIAEILGALDDKIETNRRINRVLEQMALALYKHWFVDFGPFQEGRFVDSERGKIPEGWTVSSLEELFPKSRNVVLTGPFGSHLHAYDYKDEGVPLILVKHVLNGRIIENNMPLVGEHKVPELGRYRLQVGDIVFTRVAVVGQSAYIHPKYDGWLISGQMLRVRIPDTDIMNPRYLAQAFLRPSFIKMVENHAVGSTRASLNTSLLRSFKFLNPPIEIHNQFAEILNPIDAQILNNITENQVLAQTRDYLLPKLLSGEVEVKL